MRISLLPRERNPAAIGRELGAGLTLLAMSVPLNIGYAQVAGLPPAAGLAALVVPTLLWALLASSRRLVAAPDASAAALIAASIAGLGPMSAGEYLVMVAAQAIVGGVVLLLAGVLRAGFLADFLSAPILLGFVAGMAVEILLSQAASMLGLSKEGDGFLRSLGALVLALPQAHLPSVVLAVIALSVLLIGRAVRPGWPWALVVLVGAGLASALLGFEAWGVAVLGAVPAGAPAFQLPLLSAGEWIALIPSALALSAVTIAEGLLLARRYAALHGDPHDPDRDLRALGVANIASGLTGSFTVGSSASRSAAMEAAGSRSQLPSVVVAVGALLLMLFGTALLAPLPSPAIAAIVAVAVLGLLGAAEWRSLFRRAPAEGAIAVVCAATVLLVGPLVGLGVSLVLALLHVVVRARRPGVELEEDAGVLLARITVPLLFVNTTAILDRVSAAGAEVRAIVLDLETVSDIDVTAADALERFGEDLATRGVRLHLARIPAPTAERLRRLGLLPEADRHPTVRAALVAARTDAVDTTG